MNFKHFKRFNLLVLFCAVIVSGCASGQKAVDITPIQPPSKQSINSVIANLSKQIVSNMLKQKKSKVAVTNFLTLKGERTELGLFLSDKLTNSLFQFSNKFEVVERSRMEAVQEEIGLGASGVIDDDTAKSWGKATGADAIVIGTITDLGDEVDISLRMLGTERANVIAVASASLEKNDAVAKLMASVAAKKSSGKKRPVAANSVGNSDTLLASATGETVAKQPQKAGQSVEMEGFLVQVQECKRSGTNIKCSFLVTNKEADRSLGISRNTNGHVKIIDYSGNEYRAVSSTLGSSSTNNLTYNDVSNNFITGIPLKVSLTFGNVLSSTKGIALLQIGFNLFTVQFRDVPLVG